MHVIESIDGLLNHVGATFGPGEWKTITQQMIDGFAQVTGDQQWIHCDTERAEREMPGGKTIAHGYLTLSLLQSLQSTLYEVRNVRSALNYGANRLRFISPVSVESRVRLVQVIKSVEPVEGGIRVIAESTFQIEGQTRPALVVETIGLYFR